MTQKTSTDLRDRTFDDLVEGESLTALHISVTPDHINSFQDFLGHTDPKHSENPWLMGNNLHIDEDFSKKNMYGGIVGDGNQTAQYLCQILTDSLPWGSLVSGYSKLDIKFTNPTRPGDEVVVTGNITQKYTESDRDYVVCDVIAKKNRDTVIAVGNIRAYVPRRTSAS